LDELFDIFERDERRGDGDRRPQRGGLRGALSRLFGGDEGPEQDHHRRADARAQAERRHGRHAREDDRFDFGDD
jgi:hypothetical protein